MEALWKHVKHRTAVVKPLLCESTTVQATLPASEEKKKRSSSPKSYMLQMHQFYRRKGCMQISEPRQHFTRN